MKRDDYLDHECVRPFVEWLRRRVGDEEAFKHSYRMLKPACDWRCSSLWEAHTNYCWRGKGFEGQSRGYSMVSAADMLAGGVRATTTGRFRGRGVQEFCIGAA